MLEVDAALAIVLQHARVLPTEPTALMTSSLGQVLGETVHADADSPPFDKAMMDGFAVRTADVPNGRGELVVVDVLAAGGVYQRVLQPGEALRIFTGAPLPPGADAVVMQERTELFEHRVRIQDPELQPSRNVLKQGTEMRRGDAVLPAGSVLTPTAFGVLATLGRTSVLAHPRPRVAIVATGDELVEPNRVPGPGQIRNSNGPMLASLVARAGGLPRYLGIAADSPTALRSYIREGLEIAPILLLAGGVSAGGLDLVPQVLADEGVTPLFHQVRMKPGKPLLFGVKGDRLVFGLPGNPVSALVGFELLVRPALRRLGGHAALSHAPLRLSMIRPHQARHDRPTYHPARRVRGGVEALPWAGSADLRAWLAADAFLILPPGPCDLQAGDLADVLPIEP